MDLQYGTEKSRITGQRSALQDPRVLMEAPRRTFIGEARANKKAILWSGRASSREINLTSSDETSDGRYRLTS